MIFMDTFVGGEQQAGREKGLRLLRNIWKS